MIMFTFCTIIFTLIISLSSINGDQPQPDDISQYAYVETELPYYNLYRSQGDWILRATTDDKMYFTRETTKCDQNKVTVSHYLGNKLFLSAVATHIPDSKIILLESTDAHQNRKSIGLYQDTAVIINLVIKPDNQKILTVLVNNLKTSHTDDDVIRNIISTKLLTKANVRQLIEDLVKDLKFVNRDLRQLNYDRQSFPVSDDELVNADLINGVANWTIRGITYHKLPMLDAYKLRVMGNKVVTTVYGKEGNLVMVCVAQYLDDSRLLVGDIIMGEFYTPYQNGILYADRQNFVVLCQLPTEPLILAVCSRDKDFDVEYMKKVIDYQLMFSNDVKRVIKDIVPKLVWK